MVPVPKIGGARGQGKGRFRSKDIHHPSEPRSRPFIKDGQEWVKFEINPIQDNRSIVISCEERVTGRKLIKNTSGISEERLVFQTSMKLGEQIFNVDLTLANRDSMEFRMLLGRDAFKDKFSGRRIARICPR